MFEHSTPILRAVLVVWTAPAVCLACGGGDPRKANPVITLHGSPATLAGARKHLGEIYGRLR